MRVDNVILGKDIVYSTDSNITGLNNNRLVVAPSGGGKTMSIGEPILLEANHSSYIVTLTKRKLVAKYKPLLERRPLPHREAVPRRAVIRTYRTSSTPTM